MRVKEQGESGYEKHNKTKMIRDHKDVIFYVSRGTGWLLLVFKAQIPAVFFFVFF